MNVLVNFARVFVGILFIFSGFVKLNDPLGFSYKLQEYFSPGVLDIPFLVPYALGLAIILVIAEILLGVALLLGYAKKFTKWSLLLMILFFTFLTFYSAYFNKVTDCGCFGDAIPLTPWQSFYKDIILLVLILIIFFYDQHIKPFFSKKANSGIIFLVFIACLSFAYYVLMHLPAIDFRAYKEGTNIEENMIPKKGELLPPINDFGFYNQEGDFTDEILNEEKILMIAAYNLAKSEDEGWSKIQEVINRAKENGYRVIALSASGLQDIESLKSKHHMDIDFYFTDETAIKTIVRSNPGLVTIKKGVIIQKAHWNDANDIELK
ncbi:BT_3928 family protein [Mesonia sp. K7]|uniref:BT_3928 family protein n=1 Tax=Mesonia sp. K7 TaxID=2218606 RepID=UPI000DA6F6E6|nr:BT_3928 family protein [Mesonia sp. K7]PZD78039.1 DoxX family protein [Mesonia sp. K7]